MSNEPQDNSVENVSEEVVQDETLEAATEACDGSDEEKGEDSTAEVAVEEFSLLKEQALRAKAETQNTRRRAEQDIEKARKFALEKFVSDLLPVVDNLERAIDAGNKDDESQKAVLEGVELTLKSLVDTLKKYSVETINPENEPFDPQFHQAMSMAPSPDVEPNTVINVFQKGYALNGRLVRPAMVVVSSAP